MKSRVKIFKPSIGLALILLMILPYTVNAQKITNENWNPGFSLPGTASTSSDNPILDILSTSDGYFITGHFSSIDGVAANSIAFWNGENWNALGEGLQNEDNTIGEGTQLFKDEESIYVVGQFTQAGTEEVSNIAIWDEITETWSSIPGEFNGSIYSVLKNGNLVFVGGDFSQINGSPYNHIAVWDGEGWSTFNGGVNGPVNVIKRAFGQYYFGGDFSIAGGATVTNNMATWTGTSWNNIGNGSNGIIYDMHFIGDSLLVGGNFSSLGGESINNLGIRTDGTWSGFDISPDNTVFDIDGTHTDMVIVGEFDQIGILNTSGFARWDGNSWEVPSNAPSPFFTAFGTQKFDEKWIIVGDFETLEGTIINNIAAVDVESLIWEEIGLLEEFEGVNGTVNVVKHFDGITYIGGNFSGIGSKPIQNFAAKIDGEWVDLGASPNGPVRAILATGTQIYLGGSFTNVGGVSALNIARYLFNDGEWSGLNDGLNGTVHALELQSGSIYAGGTFTQTGDGISRPRIARWSGTGWIALGSGINDGSAVYDLEILNGKLYAGGSFTEAGGIVANNIASWNGTNWEALEAGVNGSVNVIAKTDTSLFVGGDFSSSSGKSVSNISEWIIDTQTWEPLSEGLNEEVLALQIHQDTLFAGGDFTTSTSTDLVIGGGKQQLLNRIAFFGENKWNPIGSGVSSSTNTSAFVNSMTTSENELIIVGRFDRAGENVSSNIASLNLSGMTTSNEEELSKTLQIKLNQNYPNPFNPSTTISFELLESGSVSLKVFNILGQEIASLVNGKLRSGIHAISFDASNFPSGVYIYQLTSSSASLTKKMLLIK